MLRSFKHPKEFRRPQLSILNLERFKASDYRSFLYYFAVIIFCSELKTQYYQNFLLYVTAIRLLTDEYLNEKKIMAAYNLMVYFIKQFNILYGKQNMQYNLHAHIHLAEQAAKWGPLHKISCFPFEGIFKIAKSSVYGFRGYANQLQEFFQLQRLILTEIKELKIKMIDERFCSLIEKKDNFRYPSQGSNLILDQQTKDYFSSVFKENYTVIEKIKLMKRGVGN